MAAALLFDEFRDVVRNLEAKYRPFHEGEAVWDGEPTDDYVPDYNLKIPPWICQPYYRPPPAVHVALQEEKQKAAEQREIKHKYFDKEGNAISRKRMKKLKRLEKRAKTKIERHGELCVMEECDNTRGLKCVYEYCRVCCRKKCFVDTLNCSGHKVFIKDKRDRKQQKHEKQKMKTNDDGEDDMEVETNGVSLSS
jgi:tRNA-dihydrouridine synthase 1